MIGEIAFGQILRKKIPQTNEVEISELLFFKHKAKPLGSISISSLHNNYLAYAHDDGWVLKLYYTKWKFIEKIIDLINRRFGVRLDQMVLKKGKNAYRLEIDEPELVEKTWEIDKFVQKKIKAMKSGTFI